MRINRKIETVSSCEVRANWSKLLKRVELGEDVVITKRGIPIAKLVPARVGAKADMKQLIAEMIEFGKGRSLGGLSIRDMIDQGRRF